MASFDQEIKDFTSKGTFNYSFDEAGNVVLNPSSSKFQENYLALRLSVNEYDMSKVLSFYNPTFTEFVNTQTSSSTPAIPQDVLDQITLMTQQNQELSNQLDSLIQQTQTISAAADAEAIKNIIIGLRIQLGQGRTESDFDDNFPYIPIPLDARDSAPTT